MPDYKTEQDWLMGEIEAQQEYMEREELAETVAEISRELRTRIVIVMREHKPLAALSAKECFDRWKAGYLAQRAGAVKVLETAKKLLPQPDIGF